MSTLSEESRQIVASLACRVGPNADVARIAEATVSILQAMDAGVSDSAQAAPDLIALKSVLVEQSAVDALHFGEVLLTTFYELLTTLIGPALTARLLRGVWEPSLSDTPSQENSP